MQNLKHLRNEAHLTQLEMSRVLTMSLRGYQDIESGKNETSYSNLCRIADYFGCSIDYLLGHQTPNTLQLDELSETQQKLVDVIRRLTPAQASFALGYFSDMLGLPYSAVRPTRPF